MTAQIRLQRTRWVGVALATVATAGLLMFSTLSPAQAHNYLMESTPTEGEELTVLPDEFVITTNDALLKMEGNNASFGLQVIDTDGLYYGDGCVDLEGPSMSTAAALGEPGDYMVRWQIVSIDGHTVSEEYAFTWQPDGEFEVSAGATSAPVCGEAGETDTDTPRESDDTVAPAPAPEVTTQADEADSSGSSDLLWIGGAIVAVVIAGGATMLALSRKKK